MHLTVTPTCRHAMHITHKNCTVRVERLEILDDMTFIDVFYTVMLPVYWQLMWHLL